MVVKTKGTGRQAQDMRAKVRRRKAAALLAKGYTAKDALLGAGYSASTAGHTSAQVLEKIRHELARQLDRQLPKNKIVEELISLALGAERIERIYNPATGTVETYRDADPFARCKALELIGKFSGSLTHRQEIKVSNDDSIADRVKAAWQRVQQAEAAAKDKDSVEAEIVVRPRLALPGNTEATDPQDRAFTREDSPFMDALDISGHKSGAQILAEQGDMNA
jgi:hypothetical protein